MRVFVTVGALRTTMKLPSHSTHGTVRAFLSLAFSSASVCVCWRSRKYSKASSKLNFTKFKGKASSHKLYISRSISDKICTTGQKWRGTTRVEDTAQLVVVASFDQYKHTSGVDLKTRCMFSLLKDRLMDYGS